MRMKAPLLNRQRIDSQELETLLNDRRNGQAEFLLVDIREPYEYEAGHIVGVDLLLPTTQLQRWAPVLAERYRDIPLILTCRTSNRTAQVQHILVNQLGMDHVIDHTGGIVTWKGAVAEGMEGARDV